MQQVPYRLRESDVINLVRIQRDRCPNCDTAFGYVGLLPPAGNKKARHSMKQGAEYGRGVGGRYYCGCLGENGSLG